MTRAKICSNSWHIIVSREVRAGNKIKILIQGVRLCVFRGSRRTEADNNN